MKNILVFPMICLLLFFGCGGKDPTTSAHQHGDEEHAHGQAGEMHSHEGEIVEHGEEHTPEGETHEHDMIQIPETRQREWGIEVGRATKQEMIRRIALPGVLKLNQNKTGHITSYVQGQVSVLNADLGHKVRKGQKLVTINSPEFASVQADFLQARTRFLLSQKEFERARMLLEQKAIEEKEYLRREAEFQKLATEYGALGSRLHSFGLDHDQIDGLIEKCQAVMDKEYKCEIADPYLPILSPLSGTVIFRDALIGEHIQPGKILFQVSDLTKLWAVLDAYEKDIPYLKKNSRVTIHSSLYPEKEFKGRVSYIHDLIDEKLRTVKIRVEVDNSEGLLKPHMFIEGRVDSKPDGQQVLVVPEEAVQNLNGEKIVFIRTGYDVYSVRHITTGIKIGKNLVVANGLGEEDILVVKGAFTLKTELTKGTFGHSHVH
jgi:cobalt-zinc-cadmium efflux system membrane fusion protein